MVDRAAHLIRHGRPLSEDVPDLDAPAPEPWNAHPPTWLRMEYLAMSIEKDTRLAREAADVGSVYDWVEHLHDEAWKELGPVFRTYYLHEVF
jgi:hypothetical protein